ncbi:MAG: response regulator [Endomicrobiales bacterium]|nr:response regulator [Endomicrobiales bacterium]
MSGKKVLIVDDDATLLEMLQGGLEMMGYAVDIAVSGDEMAKKIEKSLPDVVLMDVNLPGTDGIILCRNLKSSPDTKDIPVIMLTAFNDQRTYHDSMLFGATEFIAKPFEMEEILKKIEQCIAKARVKKESKAR